MLKNVLLAGAAIAALASVSVPARADNIVVNQWYAGNFAATGSPLLGGGNPGTHGPILPWPAFGNAVAAPAPAWVITTSSGGTFTITDVETSGDRFQLFDNGVAMVPAASPFGPAPQNPGQAGLPGGLTSVPCAGCSTSVNDINAALGNANYSSATFYLPPGVSSVTGTFLGTIKFGDFNFIVETPEPAGLAVLGVGLLGLGLAVRRRRG